MDFLVLDEKLETTVTADMIQSRVIPLGQRFYPSTSAFPLRMWINRIRGDCADEFYRTCSNAFSALHVSTQE